MIGFGQGDAFEGDWIYKGIRFENILNLTKIEGKDNIYNFTFDCWRRQYCNLLNDSTRFSGEMVGEVFVIEIKDNKAYYNDDVQEFDKGWELYNEGEERCNVYFEFKTNEIIIRTEFCNLLYGGWGISFDGTYKKL